MSEKLTAILLSGLTPDEFLIYYFIGILGILVRWLYNVGNSIWFDSNTPYQFKWRYIVKGLIRLFTSLIVMAFIIARFYEFSDHVVHVVSEGEDPIRANITAGAVFIIGLGIDEIVKRIVGRTIKHYKL